MKEFKGFHNIVNYMMKKFGFLIPSTSTGRVWKDYKDTYLYQNTLRSFLQTYDKEYHTHFYIGIDRNDPIYDAPENKENFKRFVNVMKNVDIEFVYMENVNKGHLTVMWNQLYDKAISDDCDYFVQCGDDIEFTTTGWMKDAVKILEKSNGVGVVGPMNNNPRLLTQTIVTRKHKELFGYYFPPEIKNWFCDDWINEVYKYLHHYYPMTQHYCINIGGTPRYVINDGKSNEDVIHLLKEILRRDVERTIGKI